MVYWETREDETIWLVEGVGLLGEGVSLSLGENRVFPVGQKCIYESLLELQPAEAELGWLLNQTLAIEMLVMASNYRGGL